MKLRLLSIAFCAALGLAWFGTGVSAAEPLVTLRLSALAMERGYTVQTPDAALLLGIRPGTFAEEGIATILEEELNLPAPSGYTQVSPQYIYDVSMSQPRVLSTPVVLALRSTSDKPWRKTLGFYNRIANTWQLVPSWVQGDGRIRAFLPFPYSRVALFEQAGVLATGLNLRAKSFAVTTEDAQTVLLGYHEDEEHILASLTKLMTAIVVLEANPGLSGTLTYSGSDDRAGATLGLRAGESVQVRDLFFCTLVMSANNCAAALARSTGLPQSSFVARMNEEAAALGLTRTHFTDPTGLDVGNVSTAQEYAYVAREAFRYFAVLQATTIPSYTFTTNQRSLTVRATDTLIGGDLYLTGGKTGYLPEAGYNLVIRTRSNGEQFITVLLGQPTSAGRFTEAASLARLAPLLAP